MIIVVWRLLLSDEKKAKLFERSYYRERKAREEAELLLENKTRELHLLNQDLEKKNSELTKMLKDLVRVQKKLSKLAHFDVLTRLPNRLQFEQDLKREIARSKRYGRSLALLSIDLDFFKNVNDRFGHDVGDCLLREVAKGLRSIIREEDYVARLAGDEFAVILTEINNPQQAKLIANNMIKTFAHSFTIKGHTLIIGISIGIAYFPDAGNDSTTLRKNADIALYNAKECGRNNCQIFTPSLRKQYSRRLGIGTELHLALERQEFFLVYQPRFELKTNTMVGMEVLLRWQHPKKGIVLPEEFIMVAEHFDLIIPIGEWVLRTACGQYVDWKKRYTTFNCTLVINISLPQFQHKGFISSVKQILHEYQMPSYLLEFEITEVTIVNFLKKIKDTLNELHNMGIKLAFDNFEAGYSFLSHLKNSPVQSIKLKQSLIEEDNLRENDNLIIKSMIALSRELGLNVVVGGVETEEQLNFLRSSHCSQVQGYYSSKPLTAEQMTQFIDGNGYAGKLNF
ncbi:bifunctional diguanylate cyclase/phosphodiesterase [Legionella pneumophila]|nr:bifunctional diguanylate cyclase/phosphodiesterase [Legionella pneumophila]HAT4425246.1 bifunctional diguanylate cyclase/phosphodiesterase [Legionella pneumophila]HAU1721757.1 bifunctional diguanylate cyclase/phosphodiesterase [Legionella pneumophila]